MKELSTSNKLAGACVALTLIAADISVAQDAAAQHNENEVSTNLVSTDTLPAAGGEDYREDDLPPALELSEEEPGHDELIRNFESYKSALEIGSYDEADFLAKRVVELSIRLYGLDSHEAAKALSNLGLAQQKNKDYESAVLNFTAAIGIVERIEDKLNRELIRPLRGLGASQLGSGRPGLASAAFDRAIHIGHVNDGPHNLQQIGILEDLAEVHLTSGNVKKAVDLHEYIYILESRNINNASEDILPALERQAQWLHRIKNLEQERMMWRRIIRIIEKNRGKNDLGLIAPLTGLGTSYLYASDFHDEKFTDGTMTSGDTYLKRAVRISDRNADATWEIRLKTKLSLADFYTLSLRPNRASKIYLETWNLLSAEDEHLELRATLFNQPKLLQSISPPRYLNSDKKNDNEAPPDNFKTGTIVVSYSISKRGFAKDLKIIDSNPQGIEKMENSVIRAARRLVHRPRLLEGLPVATPDQSYTHEFYYRPSALKPVDEAKAEIEPQPEEQEQEQEQEQIQPQNEEANTGQTSQGDATAVSEGN